MTEELDSTSTELVLRRAFELAEMEPTRGSSGGVERSTLAEAAAEVGLPADALATALAERQLGLEGKRSLLDRLVGPSQISARRTTGVGEEETTERLVEWLERGHGLRLRIGADGVVVARRRKDLVAVVTNTVRSAGGLGGLGRIRRVRAVAVDLDDRPGAVVVAADVSDKRTGAVAGGAAVTVTGVAIGGVAALVSVPVAAVVIPVSAGAGLVVSRLAHRATVRRVTEDIDEAVDGIVRGDPPPTVMRSVTRRMRRSSGE